MTPQERIDVAMAYIGDYGYIDGAHHKQWVLDQVARVLLGDEYPEWADGLDEDGVSWWDRGIAP
jgi:hypothetical protein